MKTIVLIPAVFCLLAAQEEEAEKVYRKLSPSVVSLENIETSGTGVLIDKDGTILTNAHVIVSPFPFVARIETGTGSRKKTVTYRKVEIVGVHPKYDLAIVKIDPKENKARLVPASLSSKKARAGRRVYAIGNPVAGGMTLTKTITSGMLSSDSRVMDGLTYYQFSAQVNPGNSGGPLVDKSGDVLGIVTFKITESEGIGFAIPLDKFNARSFVRMEKRKSDPRRAREILDAAKEYASKGAEYGEKFGLKDERRLVCNMIAAVLYREALTHDPTNPSIVYNVGMLCRTLDENAVAEAYLYRCIALGPWRVSIGDAYRELGFALVKQNKVKEAKVVWDEGVAKFPKEGGKIWEDLAITYIRESNFLEAAWTAAVGIQVSGARKDVLRQLYRDATSKCSADDQKELKKRERGMDRTLDKMEDAADRAKRKDEKFMTKAFKTFFENYDAIRPEEKGSDEAWEDAEKGEQAKKPKKETGDAEKIDRKIKGQISLAKNYKNSGLTKKAVEILEEVILKYPDAPRTKKARDMLKEWKGE